MKYEVWSRSA